MRKGAVGVQHQLAESQAETGKGVVPETVVGSVEGKTESQNAVEAEIVDPTSDQAEASNDQSSAEEVSKKIISPCVN